MTSARVTGLNLRTLGWILIFAGLAISITGVGLTKRRQDRKPEILGCDESVKRKPVGDWLWLTNCQLDLADATGRAVSPGRRPQELYIPIHGLGDTGRAPVLLVTKNPIYMATFLQLQSLKSPAEAGTWVTKHAEMVFPRRDAKGVVRAGPGELKFDRRPENLATDYLLLVEGAQPRTAPASGLLVVGVLLVVTGGILGLRKTAA